MKKTILSLFFLLTPVLLFSSASHAYRSTAFAVNVNGLGDVQLSGRSICILPGYKLRMSPDLTEYNGRRLYYPAFQFAWRATYINGYWELWDARQGSPGFGPFSYAPQRNSVYFTAHYSRMGPMVRVDMAYPNMPMDSFQVVDPLHPQNHFDCEWLADSYYVKKGQGENPTPVDPPKPDPIPEACGGVCEAGKACTDGCPYLGDCEFVPAQPNPYWIVRSCMKNDSQF